MKTHVVSVDDAADGLQRTEGVVLTVELSAAGVPDEEAALLQSQDVR